MGFLAAAAGISELPGAQGDITILFALIPCFFLSVWFEALVGSPFLKPASREGVRKVFFLANKFSYAMLAIISITRFIENAIVQGQIVWSWWTPGSDHASQPTRRDARPTATLGNRG